MESAHYCLMEITLKLSETQAAIVALALSKLKREELARDRQSQKAKTAQQIIDHICQSEAEGRVKR